MTHLKVLKLHAEAKLPTKAHESDAGYDLYLLNDALLYPGEFAVLSTGVAFGMESYDAKGNWVGLVRARSSAFRKGLMISGTLDQEFTGEVMVQVWNISKNIIRLAKNDRIAQVVFALACSPIIEEVKELSKTNRSNSGFGSSGR